MKLGKFFKTVLSALLAVAMIVPLVACGENASVESVELDRASLTLDIGAEAKLTYTVFPESAAGASVSWLSLDASVATVTDGTVRGVGEGKTVVRVTVGGKSADCNVSVTDPSKASVEVRGIELDPQSLSLSAGETAQLTLTFTPENATDKTVTWSSSQEAVATVADGLVKAVSAGTAVIEARSSNGITAACVVTVSGEADANKELYVARVEDLEGREAGGENPFIMAMDSSELLSVEAARESEGLSFKDFDGNDADVLQVLKDNGITDIRIRVWNDPYDSAKHSYGGGNCDVKNAVALSERCKKVGLGVIIDFHYSDFWADPGKQSAPKAWQNMNISQKETALYEFTEESLQQIRDTGVKITMVQLGNETTGGLAGETSWTNICKLMVQGSKAVRKVTGTVEEGGAKIAVHFTNAGAGGYMDLARTLANNNVDYDVFGTSWYPYYSSHGTLANLTGQLKNIHNTFKKEAMVLETAYAFTYDDFDGCGNTSFESTTQPITVQGMSNAVRDVIDAVASLGDWGLGVAYWGGTWVAASNSTSGAVNRALCKEYGCGWATSYAKGYDGDANDGGSMVDNNAFFRSDGTPIEALKVFKDVFTGHVIDLAADYIEDEEVYYTVNEGQIELPEQVNVVLNNGSPQTLQAYWNVTDKELAEYITEVNQYDITGTTFYGGECHVTVWVMNVNLLSEGSFENFTGYADGTVKFIQGGLGKWKLDYTKATDLLQLFVSTNEGNARMGKQSFHFWDEGAILFDLTQTLTYSELSEYGAGKYGCSFDIQGSDGEEVDIYAYITVKYKSGETKTFKGNKTTLDGWQKWNRTSVSGVALDDTVESVTVGIHVSATPTGAGPWGNIDNCQFYFEGAE